MAMIPAGGVGEPFCTEIELTARGADIQRLFILNLPQPGRAIQSAHHEPHVHLLSHNMSHSMPPRALLCDDVCRGSGLICKNRDALGFLHEALQCMNNQIDLLLPFRDIIHPILTSDGCGDVIQAHQPRPGLTHHFRHHPLAQVDENIARWRGGPDDVGREFLGVDPKAARDLLHLGEREGPLSINENCPCPQVALPWGKECGANELKEEIGLIHPWRAINLIHSLNLKSFPAEDAIQFLCSSGQVLPCLIF